MKINGRRNWNMDDFWKQEYYRKWLNVNAIIYRNNRLSERYNNFNVRKIQPHQTGRD